MNNIYYVKNKDIFVRCQPQGWCTSEIFEYWVKEIFFPYQSFIKEKCLLILDKASAHVSSDSINALKKFDISYVLIPAGMTPECQPLDISINKKFKDNIKYLFEENRLFINNLNAKIKLNTARLNLIDYIYKVWYNPVIITKEDIKKGFEYSGIIGNYYTSKKEVNINSGYLSNWK